MTKICGIVNFETKNNNSFCENLSEYLMEYHGQRHGIEFEKEFISFDNASFCILTIKGEQNDIRKFESKENLSFCIGHILPKDNSIDLIERLRRFLNTNNIEQAKLILLEFEGYFIFIDWNKRTQTLTIINDKLGLAPIYICKDSKKILFASEAEAILPLKFLVRYLRFSYIVLSVSASS